ncbi:hypothetical protein BV22DRAFT_1036343 [Leucogyrophana mollusca]|uniref:Uncharacterized protein n=1 Tax=Leucogyrophana mollusca TaxID=85980 RepID=A0ACB8BDA3_9AGAM|nr:hypothetical protein BV22DRAFT_1036343 [Leucogyrophana mollusca]
MNFFPVAIIILASISLVLANPSYDLWLYSDEYSMGTSEHHSATLKKGWWFASKKCGPCTPTTKLKNHHTRSYEMDTWDLGLDLRFYSKAGCKDQLPFTYTGDISDNINLIIGSHKVCTY